ncbi:MAG: O-methyltransferase [Acidimicrobiales bacterium]
MPPLVDPAIERYALEHTTSEPPHLAALAAETCAATALPERMVGPMEGRLLALLVGLARARLVVEIGTFTGYSALSMAAALPAGGRIVTCEVDPVHAEIARRHIGASPYRERVEVRVGPAGETLAELEGPFDLVFIDADKTGYQAYYEAVVPKLAPGGLVAVDNVLWGGGVVEPGDDAIAATMAAFNDHVRADPRVEVVVLTVRDGLSLIRRRPA